MKNKLLLLLLAVLFTSSNAFSSHIVGGSLTYEQLGGSTYRITLKVYRDCAAGNAAFDNTITVEVKRANGTSFSPSKNISINLGTTTVLNPYLDTCVVQQNICVEEAIYTKIVNNLPPLAGGYHLFWQRCCRNATLDNIVGPANEGESFYAFIPDNSDLISNSSPNWVNSPPTFVCQGQPINFDHAATDADGDSLFYRFYQPYAGCDGVAPIGPNCATDYPTFPGNVATFNTVTWAGGFSTNNPMGGAGLTISSTGLLNGIPPSLGQYVVGVVAEEWRNGVQIGRILRDFQFNVVNCPPLAVASFVPSNGCTGTSISFANTTTPAANSYFWNFGNTATLADTSHAVNPSYTYPALGTYTVTLIINAGTPCSDTTTRVINIATINAAFTSTPPGCQGLPVSFTDASTSSTSITNWDWTFGDGGVSTLQNPSHLYVAAGTYTVRLIVTSASGCKDTSIQSLTIRPMPVANFTANTLCYVDSVSFVNTSSISSGTITGWNWNFGDAGTSTLMSPDHYYAASGMYNVTLIATSSFGCIDTTVISMNMRPAPDANFSFTSVCANDTIDFTNTSVVVPGSSPVWNWNFGDGNTSTLQNPSNDYAVGGAYPVTLTVTTAAGCADSITQVLNISPAPVASFTANPLCYVDSLAFTNTSTIAAGSISNYLWNFGDGNTSTLTNPNHYYSAAGMHTITLIATSASGCTDTTVTLMNIQPAPGSAFTFSGNCANSTIAFSNTSVTISGTSPTWSWNFGDTATSTAFSPTHIYNSGGTFNVTMIATTAAGCADTTVTPVTIDPTPVAGFTSNSMCYADSVRFINTSTISSGAISSWSWDFGDGNTSTLQDPVHFYATSGMFNITLIAFSASGCNDTITIPMNVQPAPLAAFTSTATACENAPVAFSNTSTLSSGTFSSWSWDFGDGNTSAAQDPVHSFTVSGVYNIVLVVTAASGCADTVTHSVNIDASPIASFTQSNPCSVDSIDFTSTSTISGGSITSWNWAFGDGGTSTQTNPSYLYGSAGSYNVTLIVQSNLGCADTVTSAINVALISVGFTDNGPACQGVAINFNDTSLVDATTTITGWNWSFGDGTFSTLQNPSHPYSAGGIYTVQLVISTATGCTDSTTHTINIQGYPVANAGSDTSKCSNNPEINITGTVVNAGGGQWFGSGNFSPNQFILNPVYTPTAAAVANGFDTLMLVTTSNALCPADTDQVIITFNAAPSVNAGSDIFACRDTAYVPVCASITVATGGVWHTLGTGTFSDTLSTCTQYIPSPADTTAGSATLYITSTGNADCFAVNDTITIFFSPTPIVAITSNDTSCAGNPYLLSVVSTTGSGTWSSSGTGSFSPDNTTMNGVYFPSAADDASGNITLYFNSTNNGGCKTQSDTINLTLISSPVVAFTSVPACPFLPVSFSNNTTSVIPVVSWSWNFGDGNSGSQQNPSHIYPAGGPYTVSLIATSTNGCVDTSTQVVNVHYQPVADYDASGACRQDGTQFTDSSTVTGSTISTWAWNFGDGETSNLQNPVHLYSSAGNFIAVLVVSSAEGCMDTTLNTISILPSPSANFIADDYTANLNQTVNFQDLSGSNAVSWQWDFGDAQSDSTSTLQNPSHAYQTGGFYDVCLYVSDINGCTDTACQQVIVSLPPVIPTGFSPNGDGENDVFYVYGGPFKTLEFRIYNNWGEIIYTSDKQSEGWDGKRKGIDQPIGVYVYTVYAITETGEEHHLSGDVTLLR
ncbi:MAG TPA: PKD domain-containing protein [Bacteroidia bacterium]|jgi:gliding motility-associated-like protein